MQLDFFVHTFLVLLILSEISFSILNCSKYHGDFEKDAREVYPSQLLIKQ